MSATHFIKRLTTDYPVSPIKENLSGSNNLRVLTLDGGGMRGVIPATILAELEDMLIATTGNPQARIVDYFDYFAGTSTGGILTCLYLLPDEQQPGRPRFSARQVLELYTQEGSQIFYRSLRRKLTSLMGFTREKFDSNQMAMMLRRFMGETQLSDLIKPCLIPAYDISTQAPYCFNSTTAKQQPEANFTVWQVAQATASAPVYFEPTVALAADGSRKTLIDGGIFANNPSLMMYHHLQQLLPHSCPITLLSLGTGCTARPYQADDFRAKGVLRSWRPLLHVLRTAKKHSTEQQVRDLLKLGAHQYYRINPKLDGVSSAMDNVSADQLRGLQALAEQFSRDNSGFMKQLGQAIVPGTKPKSKLPFIPITTARNLYLTQ